MGYDFRQPAGVCAIRQGESGTLLTVLQVACPLAPVSFDAAGGPEQVLATLDRGLVHSGHCSLVIACDGSHTEGHLLAIPCPAVVNDEARCAVWNCVRARLREALQIWAIDIVHMHGVDFHEYLPPPGVPVLATLHLPVSFYPERIFGQTRTDTYLNCVSESQRLTCPPSGNKPLLVENGIPVNLFPREPASKSDYALALGRICREKGFHLALEAAERARVPLWIGGEVLRNQEHQEYFQQELLPRIKPPHRYLGPVGFDRKVTLLAHARCLLAASLVAETSSLVVMEALACGTPVIAFPSGAVRELVEHSKTGFLVTNPAEMAAAITHSDEIDRWECQHQARLRFSDEHMIGAYCALYKKISLSRM